MFLYEYFNSFLFYSLTKLLESCMICHIISKLGMILKTNILDLNNKKAKGFKQGDFLIQLFIYGKIYWHKFQYIMLQQIFLFLFRTSKLMKKKTSKFLILDNFHVIFFWTSVKLVNSRSAWQLLKHKLNKLSYLQMFILYLCDTRFYTYQ